MPQPPPPRSPAGRSARGLGASGGALRLVPAAETVRPSEVSRDSAVADTKETSGILAGLGLGGGGSDAEAAAAPSDAENGDGSWLARVQEAVTPAPVVEATVNRSWCCASMSYQERLAGFAVCFVLGNACSASSFAHLPEVFVGQPNAFALTYTLGNIIALGGTTFLWGPKSQIEGMTDPKRVVSALGYLATIVLTLLSAVVLRSALITLVFMIAQFIIGSYYSLSYIPGGLWCVEKAWGCCCGLGGGRRGAAGPSMADRNAMM